MKKTTATFEKIFQRFGYHYDLRMVFNDFLTLTICAFSQNPLTGKSHDEDLYLQTIAKYKDDQLCYLFPELLACLITEMEERSDSNEGNDVLGECYEEHISRKYAGQYFTPWHICTLMATLTESSEDEKELNRPLRILDPTCGSGRMLLASKTVKGTEHEYYGVDLDETCVKMAAINLFLNGMFHSEVMHADALLPEDFKGSYRISLLPFGIFRIREKEQSPLWRMLQNGGLREIGKEKQEPPAFMGKEVAQGNQLTIF